MLEAPRGASRRRHGPQLLLTLVERRLRLSAKRALFSTVWPALSPLVMLCVYWFVFSRVFTVPVARYGEFLLVGLLPWTFLSQSLALAISSLSGEPDLIRRWRFRYELLPLAAVGTMTVYLCTSMVLFIGYLGLRGRLSLPLLAVLPVPMFALLLLVASLAMVVAIIDVYNRDLRWMLNNVLMAWFFLLPIVYRHEMAPGGMRFLRSVDPMNLIIGQFRDILYWGHLSSPAHLVLMLVTTGALFMGSLSLFRHFAHELPKDV